MNLAPRASPLPSPLPSPLHRFAPDPNKTSVLTLKLGETLACVSEKEACPQHSSPEGHYAEVPIDTYSTRTYALVCRKCERRGLATFMKAEGFGCRAGAVSGVASERDDVRR